MNPDEVARACDELHEYVDEGPGERPGVFARSLGVVRLLRSAASWDYPLDILNEIESRLAHWFSPQPWKERDNEQAYRESLLDQISRLEDAWERPRS